MDEIKKLLEEQRKAFEDFKKLHTEELAQLKKSGTADPLLKAAVDAANAQIGELQKQIDALTAKAQRKPGAGEDDLVEAKAAHLKSFVEWVKRGAAIELDHKSITIGSDSEGGYTVPELLDSMIEKQARNATPMRSVCSVITVANEQYEKLRQSGTAGTGWVDEQEARTETTTPTFVALRPYFGELYSNPGATQRALDDSMLNLEAWLAEEIGLAFGEAENAAFTTGSGVKRPKGILSYDLSTNTDASLTAAQLQKVHSGSSGAFVADKVLDLIYALNARYREGAVLMTSRLGVAALRKLKDGQNNYLWQPSAQQGQPATLHGFGIVENEDVPVPAAASKSLIFGNFQRGYQIADVRGIRLVRDALTNKPKVMFYATKRVGGHVVNNQALKVQVLDT